MGTKLTEMRDGCFHKALDDEPMFVLLARDPAAPNHVRTWAAMRKQEVQEGKRPSSDLAQIQEAEHLADRMEHWREANDGRWRTGLFSGGYRKPSDPYTAAKVLAMEARCTCGESKAPCPKHEVLSMGYPPRERGEFAMAPQAIGSARVPDTTGDSDGSDGA